MLGLVLGLFAGHASARRRHER